MFSFAWNLRFFTPIFSYAEFVVLLKVRVTNITNTVQLTGFDLEWRWRTSNLVRYTLLCLAINGKNTLIQVNTTSLSSSIHVLPNCGIESTKFSCITTLFFAQLNWYRSVRERNQRVLTWTQINIRAPKYELSFMLFCYRYCGNNRQKWPPWNVLEKITFAS